MGWRWVLQVMCGRGCDSQRGGCLAANRVAGFGNCPVTLPATSLVGGAASYWDEASTGLIWVGACMDAVGLALALGGQWVGTWCRGPLSDGGSAPVLGG